ncbi:MAG TPA: hypothetical protein VMU94_31935 [Streptosporangiaceae bacterium]|nr:hypothetical protein [Streptosporangiaceae bacterium]
MTNDIVDLLNALREGTMTVDEVAQQFRTRKWPRRRRTPPTTYAELAATELEDPDPYLPGSYDDVAAAFHQKKITREQFRVLSDAVAEAQRAEDAGEG